MAAPTTWPTSGGDGGAAVAIERGGELAAFAYRRGQRIGPAAARDETAFLQAVAAAGAGPVRWRLFCAFGVACGPDGASVLGVLCVYFRRVYMSFVCI